LKTKKSSRFPNLLWMIILILVIVIVTFPRWIIVFYPQPNRDLVFAAAYEHNVDPYLVFAVMRAESRFETSARSAKGARGLMQIMPDTGRWIASQQGISDFDPDMLHDPETNIRFGCWYLASLSREFDDRLPLVAAAYNAGRGKTRQWVAEGKWNGDPQRLDQIPFPETQAYVGNVLANYRAYRAIYAH